MKRWACPRVDGRVRFMVQENWRFQPCYRRVATRLAGERIGTPVLARIRVRPSGLVPDADGSYPAAGIMLESGTGAIGEFVEGLRSGRRFETEATDNLQVLALVEQVYASAQARHPNRFEMAGAKS